MAILALTLGDIGDEFSHGQSMVGATNQGSKI